MEVVIGLVIVFLILRWLVKKGQVQQTAQARTKPPAAGATRTAPARTRPVRYEAYAEPDPTPAQHDPAELTAFADRAWLPAGTPTTVGGYDVTGGCLYVGRKLPGATTTDPDPALINPDLKVDATRPDWTGDAMSYWPSYSKITPRSRAAYLAWLAGGRRAPQAAIGYVFLYFYGLERRILVDAQTSDAAAAEVPALLGELRRLLSIYGDNYSFRSYATGLIGAAAAAAPGRRYDSPPPKNDNTWSAELPLEVKLGLGQLVADGKPIPAEWALAWLRWTPETRLRTPATRCPAEFEELFANEYRSRYGDGMQLKANKAELRLNYQPASSGFRGAVAALTIHGVPDVGALTAPVARLAEIADAAMSALDPYSRYLGRNPEAAGTAAAAALLPHGVNQGANSEADAIWSWAETTLGTRAQVTVPATELISRWPGAENGKLPKNEVILAAQLLERRGIGVEPDPRFGGATPAPGSTLVLFRRGQQLVSAASDACNGATALLQLAAAVAIADGTLGATEEQLLTQHVIEGLGLADDEQRRLRAHLALVMAHPPTPAALRRRLAALPDSDRRDAGQLLIAIAAADGHVTPAEVDALVRLFAALGLDETSVYGELHSLAATGNGLAATRLPGAPADGYALPEQQTPTQEPRPAVVLDPALVQAKLEETGRVAALLQEIFVDEESTPATAAAPAATTDQPAAGDGRATVTLTAERVGTLDAAHSALFRQLLAQPQWTRSEFEALAGQGDLLPDGALDTLNEAALDASGEPLCEGTEPIEINTYAAEEMQR